MSGKGLDNIGSRFCCIFGLNDKGSMDKVEFEKYLFHSIVPVCLDSLDITSKRVAVKLDSGPGKINPEMMACLCCQRFCMYPEVPNTATVTQLADGQYGPLKTKCFIYLSEFCSDRDCCIISN